MVHVPGEARQSHTLWNHKPQPSHSASESVQPPVQYLVVFEAVRVHFGQSRQAGQLRLGHPLSLGRHRHDPTSILLICEVLQNGGGDGVGVGVVVARRTKSLSPICTSPGPKRPAEARVKVFAASRSSISPLVLTMVEELTRDGCRCSMEAIV